MTTKTAAGSEAQVTNNAMVVIWNEKSTEKQNKIIGEDNKTAQVQRNN